MKCAKLELNIVNLLPGTAISKNVWLDVLIYLAFMIEYYSASVQRLYSNRELFPQKCL